MTLHFHMTPKKVRELLLELPSKALIVRRVLSFRTNHELEDHLTHHFQFPTPCASELALVLRGLVRLDWEHGTLSVWVEAFVNRHLSALKGNVENRSDMKLARLAAAEARKRAAPNCTDELFLAEEAKALTDEDIALELTAKAVAKAEEKASSVRDAFIQASLKLDTAKRHQVSLQCTQICHQK